jgi:hypothetical protein
MGKETHPGELKSDMAWSSNFEFLLAANHGHMQHIHTRHMRLIPHNKQVDRRMSTNTHCTDVGK